MTGEMDDERFRKLLLGYPQKAIEWLFNHYYKELYSLAITFTRDRESAREVLQDTFLHICSVHKALSQPHTKSIRHYLIKVVKYKAITYYKKEIRTDHNKLKFMNGHPYEVFELPIDQNMVREETYQQVRAIIRLFPKRERECLQMKFDEELNTKQMAERLNVSVKEIERAITSAYKRLRTYGESIS